MDSNAFFIPLQLKMDITRELEKLLEKRFEMILLSPIKEELEGLAKKSSPKTRKNALHALKMASNCKLMKINRDSWRHPDDAILRVAEKHKYPVFTNDAELRKKLRNINVPVIYVRQKSRLAIEGRI